MLNVFLRKINALTIVRCTVIFLKYSDILNTSSALHTKLIEQFWLLFRMSLRKGVLVSFTNGLVNGSFFVRVSVQYILNRDI